MRRGTSPRSKCAFSEKSSPFQNNNPWRRRKEIRKNKVEKAGWKNCHFLRKDKESKPLQGRYNRQ